MKDLEIGQIYYLCTPDGVEQYIKPTTEIVNDVIYVFFSSYKEFINYTNFEFYLKLNLLKDSIIIHNKDFHKYPNLCKIKVFYLEPKTFISYRREILINNLINI